MVKKVGRFTFGSDGKVDEMATAVDNFQQEAEERLLDRLVSPETARALDETIPEYLSGINSQLIASHNPYPEIALGLPLNHGLPSRLSRFQQLGLAADFEGDTLSIIGMHGDFEGDTLIGHWVTIKHPVKVKKGPGKGRVRFFFVRCVSILHPNGYRETLAARKAKHHGELY